MPNSIQLTLNKIVHLLHHFQNLIDFKHYKKNLILILSPQ